MASSSAPARKSKSEKEREKGVQDRLQLLLTAMLKDEDNKYCVDCDSKGPRWASWNLGLFVCIRCAGIHRNLGVHISKVKSVNLDSWTPQQVASMQQMGNSRARAVYEANLPDGFTRPQNDQALEQFIRAKYEKKKYMAKEYVPSKPPEHPEGWFELIEAEKQKKDPRKIVLPSHNNNNNHVGGVATRKASDSSGEHANGLDDAPKAASAASNVSKAAVPSPVVAPKAAASAHDDLLGLALDNGICGTASAVNTLQDDFLGLGLSSHTSPGSGLPSSSAPSDASNSNALPDGLFSQPNGSTGDAAAGSKMSKDSIMALFGNMASTPRANPAAMALGSTSMSMGNVSMPLGNNTSMGNSPFGQPQHHSQSLFNMPAQTSTSPFMGGASNMQSSPFGMNPQSNPFLNSSPGSGFGPMTSANPLPNARPQFPAASNQNQFGGLLGGLAPSTPQQSISSDNNGLLGLWQ